jgi:hypothetical protein
LRLSRRQLRTLLPPELYRLVVWYIRLKFRRKSSFCLQDRKRLKNHCIYERINGSSVR